MSRMHSSGRGRSGSKKPVEKKVQAWVRYKPKEAEMLIVKLAKDGKNASEIGIILRDTYGIPSVRTLMAKTINEVLKEKSLLSEIPEDVAALIKKSISLEKHMEENKQDMSAKRGLQLTTSKILRLVKYYKGIERLPKDWKFDKSKMRLLIE
ncbi:30S ribosomal protein S15 [Candidatus Woesearchaeota archaeon]|nr:30S ribosomal protein S15 [Candidatus Woesearchaeota archaeon]